MLQQKNHLPQGAVSTAFTTMDLPFSVASNYTIVRCGAYLVVTFYVLKVIEKTAKPILIYVKG